MRYYFYRDSDFLLHEKIQVGGDSGGLGVYDNVCLRNLATRWGSELFPRMYTKPILKASEIQVYGGARNYRDQIVFSLVVLIKSWYQTRRYPTSDVMGILR